MSIQPAVLVLVDGSTFHGVSIGALGMTVGEVVFNTAMTGYQEILTDPSYCRQLVTLTYPHIGNTGCNEDDAESSAVHAAGLIVRSITRHSDQWRCTISLPDYLRQHGLVGIAEIDTRRLTRILREKGAQNGCIVAGEAAADVDAALAAARAFPGLQGMDLAQVVSTAEPYLWDQGSFDLERGSAPCRAGTLHVVAYDFGIKRNILRMLVDQGCRVTVVPARTAADAVLRMNPDGVFLSNGPGDPEPCHYAVEAIRTFIARRVPLFGICLGHQLLGLAVGAKTIKMKFGHHGANHPVIDLDRGRVMISSQNHGFVVDESTLPSNVRVTHRSLFDGSLQGIALTDAPAYGFQGHPEASPGPHDAAEIFAPFVRAMRARQVVSVA